MQRITRVSPKADRPRVKNGVRRHNIKPGAPSIASCWIALLLLTLAADPSGAASIRVTDFVDDANETNGTCTLREAIRSANDNASVDACPAGSSVVTDLIVVVPGVHIVDLSVGGNENLSLTGDLDILGPVEIRGASSEFSIIDGTSPTTIDRLFHILDGAGEVIIEDVALRGGFAASGSQAGGLLLNEETGTTPVELIEVEISGGTALLGGGIVNAGNLAITRSRISGNQTIIDPGSGTNHGGGIASSGAGSQLRIEDSEISNNQSDDDGGGIWLGGGTLKLYRSRIIDNVAGGNGGGLALAASDFDVDYVDLSQNQADLGGGIHMSASGEVQHSLFFGNQATTAGGGLYDAFGGFARFSTFTGNTAPMGAGVFANTAQTLLDSDTIASNVGDGVFNQAGIFFENTLVAQNSGGNCAGNAPAFGAFNLEDTNTCLFVSSAAMPNFPNTDPMLGPLQDNGGPTRTLALTPGSPAIDVVTSEIRMNCEKMRDQRGYPRGRPRTQNGVGDDVFLCDLGAFEATTPFVVDSLIDTVDDDVTDDVCLTATGFCTLRAAIQQANAIRGMHEIELGSGIHTLSLSGADEDDSLTGDLDLTTPLTIRGAGAGLTTIDAASIDRVMELRFPEIIVGASGVPDRTFISGLTITGGDAGVDNGGAIATLRALHVEGVVLSGNQARRGAALSSGKTGLFQGERDAIVEIVDSTVTNNSGALPLYLIDARITNSSLINNAATISTNGGAGEFVRVELTNSTVSGNHADATGAFFAGQAIIDSSTIYDNSGNFAPGGVFLLGLSVFRNSVVASNLAGGVPDNCALNPAASTSFGHNLTDTDATDCSLSDPTDIDLTDPLLGVLSDNFGPTETHLPVAGSPLIDAGDDPNCPVTDQRGLLRPQDGDQNSSFVCDIGAVEVPEPAFVVALMVGFLGFVGLARRRTRRSRALATAKPPAPRANARMTRRSLPIATLALCCLATSAVASDGIVEINRICAVQTGCFPGDSAGYPVTITGVAGRSYQLTSDLLISGQNTTAIEISSPDISINLAGFRISCTNFIPPATIQPCSTTGSGSGSGIKVDDSSTESGVEVRNGSIFGMPDYGVRLGNQCRVRNLRVSRAGNAGIRGGSACRIEGNTASLGVGSSTDGIFVAAESTVSRNTTSGNGGDGINTFGACIVSGNVVSANGDDGIRVGSESVVSGNTVSNNGSDGISAGGKSLVSGNTVSGSGNDGITVTSGSTVGGNTVNGNTRIGIFTLGPTLIVDNNVSSNSALGLGITNSETAYRGNLLSANSSGNIGPLPGLNLGGNACDGTICP